MFDGPHLPQNGASAPHCDGNIISYFLTLLYSTITTDSRLVLSYVEAEHFKSEWLKHDDLAGAIDFYKRHQANPSTYFGVALRKPNATTRRGAVNDVLVVPGLWSDVDVAGYGHKQDALPLSQADAIDFIYDAIRPLQPSLVVDTGGGVHPYWLFKEPFVISCDADRDYIQTLNTRLARHLIRTAREKHSWKLDNVGDLTRVLRVPGTMGKRGEQVLIQQDNAIRYELEILEHYLPQLPPLATAGEGIKTNRLDIVNIAEHYGAILTRKTDTELNGSHPIHGSTTGTNFDVNAEKQLWHCWRCNTGGDVLYLIAMGEGVIDCDAIEPGSLGGKAFTKTVKIANEKFGAGIELGRKNGSRCNGTEAKMYQVSACNELDNEPSDDEPPDKRPELYVTHDITAYVDQGIQALMDKPDLNLFQRDGMLVAVHEIPRKAKSEHETNPIIPRITVASNEYIQEMANQAADWYKPDDRSKGRYKQGTTPAAFVRFMKGRPSWPFRILTSVTTVPTIRQDGSIIETPGYDETTGLYYHSVRKYPPVLEHPTRDDAREAYTALVEPFQDFPFVSNCHMSVAIASTLSITARHLVKTVPAFPVRSNVPGSGKGLLVNVASIMATGREGLFWDEVTDPEEERKRLLVIALDGDRVTCLDNLTQPLGSGPLDRAITQATAKGRILGLSKNVEVELNTVFFATGNNMTFAGDMARRVVPIDMSPQCERPEERKDFKYPELISWVIEKHPHLLVAALTLLKAYIQAGKPEQNLSQYGSFEEWNNLVRSALVWVDAPDPCEAREGIQAENDTAYDDLRSLMRTWRRCYHCSESKALVDVFDEIKAGIYSARMRMDGAVDSVTGVKSESAYTQGENDLRKWADLETALDTYCKYQGDNPTSKAKSISRNLPSAKTGSRIIDGMRLVSEPHSGSKKTMWRVTDA